MRMKGAGEPMALTLCKVAFVLGNKPSAESKG